MGSFRFVGMVVMIDEKFYLISNDDTTVYTPSPGAQMTVDVDPVSFQYSPGGTLPLGMLPLGEALREAEPAPPKFASQEEADAWLEAHPAVLAEKLKESP